MTEKRYITTISRNTNRVLELLRNADTKMPADEVYYNLIRKLDDENISYRDSYASHHSELSLHDGFVSFYLGRDGWSYSKH